MNPRDFYFGANEVLGRQGGNVLATGLSDIPDATAKAISP